LVIHQSIYVFSLHSLSELIDCRQESETREKQEKIAEHKRMTADRAKIEAEIAKVAEQLAACVSYKQFLEKLVPEEWKTEQAKLVRFPQSNPKFCCCCVLLRCVCVYSERKP
jgi:Tfp pilus assembly protein PilF